jgi:hypothetical protein
MSEDARHEQARAEAEKAKRDALEAVARAQAEAERIKAEASTGETLAEGLRQLGVIYGGLIGIAVVMIQPFLVAPSIDTSARISIIAFSMAIPLLSALILVNRQEVFRGRRARSATVVVVQSLAQFAAVVGIAAGFWHITWVAGVTFVVAAVVAVAVHSTGWWRVESTRPAA